GGTGSTTWALVIREPVASTNQPVPVSTNGVGRTVRVPRPQFIVTSPRTSAVTSATAGVASRSASWMLTADAAAGARRVRAASPRTRAAFIAREPITGAGRHTKRRPAEYNARMPAASRTDANLQVALAGE